jgi:hypothetical protein
VVLLLLPCVIRRPLMMIPCGTPLAHDPEVVQQAAAAAALAE